MGINVSGVQVLQNPADGQLRRKILPRLQSQGLQVGGGVLPYRSQAATAGQHSGHGQRQHRKQVMTHTRLSRGSVTLLRTWTRGWRDRTVVVEDDISAGSQDEGID